MAGLAATRLFSAGGAGGIVLTYWALRKAGMPRAPDGQPDGRLPRPALRASTCSRWSSSGSCCAPASSAGQPGRPDGRAGRDRRRAIIVFLAARRPDPGGLRAAHRRASREGYRFAALRAAAGDRARDARDRHADGDRPSSASPRAAGWRSLGAIGFWAANIGDPLGRFHAYDVQVPLGVVVQGFFIGMVANLFPFAPGGVGAVDAGMIGAFVLFGLAGRDGVRRRADLPADRLLAADPARDRRLLPAAPDGRALGAREAPAGASGGTGERLSDRPPLLQKVKYNCP